MEQKKSAYLSDPKNAAGFPKDQTTPFKWMYVLGYGVPSRKRKEPEGGNGSKTPKLNMLEKVIQEGFGDDFSEEDARKIIFILQTWKSQNL